MIKVLIVEDSSFMINVIKNTLSKESDIEVIGSAKSGSDGVKMVKELNPDCVTMDINMPKMNGVEAVKKIIDLSKNLKKIIKPVKEMKNKGGYETEDLYIDILCDRMFHKKDYNMRSLLFNNVLIRVRICHKQLPLLRNIVSLEKKR